MSREGVLRYLRVEVIKGIKFPGLKNIDLINKHTKLCMIEF